MSIITHFTPTLSWAEARASFLTAYGAEKLHDDLVWTPAFQAHEGEAIAMIPAEIDAEASRLTEARSAAEEIMIAAIAPDMAAVLIKIEYARHRWQECDDWPEAWWNAVLADLRRLGGEA